MTWFWLRFLDLLKPIYLWQGVDFGQLRAIVGVKLEMDNRRPPAFKTQQQQKEHSSAFLLTLFFYTVFGAFLAAFIANAPSIVFSFSVYHAFLMVMLTLTLVSDFSAILLDTSDNTIVLPRPITAKTFYSARTTHILLYLGQISLGLALVPIVATFFVHGSVAGVGVILTTILTVIFSVGLTNGLYLLMMRFTSEERLKSMINYFQIGMVILMMGGYQLLPRLIGSVYLENVASDLHWWSIVVPPMWMAGAIKLAAEHNFGWIYLTATILAVTVPIAGWRLVTKYLAPYFTSKIADLGTNVASTETSSTARPKESATSKIGHWITKNGIERAAYSMVAYALSRDRKLKLRIYPAIGAFVIIVAVFILQFDTKSKLSFVEYIQSLQNTEKHLIVIYACIYVLIAASFEIHFTDEHKAAWVFFSAPIKKPGEILIGTLKAILVKFFLPLYITTSVIVLAIWKEKAFVDLVFGALVCILLMITMAIIADKHLPLSLAPTARNQGGSVARALLTMLIIVATSVGHYFLTKLDWALWIASPLLIVSCYFILRLYRTVEWEEIKD